MKQPHLRQIQIDAIRTYAVVHGYTSLANLGEAMGLEADDWRQYSGGHRLLTHYHIARMVAVCDTYDDADPSFDSCEHARREYHHLLCLVGAIALIQYESAKLEPSRRSMWSAMPAPLQR